MQGGESEHKTSPAVSSMLLWLIGGEVTDNAITVPICPASPSVFSNVTAWWSSLGLYTYVCVHLYCCSFDALINARWSYWWLLFHSLALSSVFSNRAACWSSSASYIYCYLCSPPDLLASSCCHDRYTVKLLIRDRLPQLKLFRV